MVLFRQGEVSPQPKREGAFSANLNPETLKSFKEICQRDGKQYSKVLERLVEIYLQCDGALPVPPSAAGVAPSTPVPASSSIETRGSTLKEVLERLDSVESDGREFSSAFEMLLHRVEALEDKDNDTTQAFGDAYKRIQHLEKAIQHRDKKESRTKPAT